MKFTLPILRVQANSRVECQIAVDPSVAVPTHWLGRQRVVCAGGACPACEGDAARLHVYAVVDELRLGKLFLLELTEASWLSARFLTGRSTNPELSCGDCISLCRKSKTSPVRVEVFDHQSVRAINPEMTALRALAALYRLPLPLVDESVEAFGKRVQRHIVMKQLPLLKELGWSVKSTPLLEG